MVDSAAVPSPPLVETAVSFASGAVTGNGVVQWAGPITEDRFVVVVDQTPFHPLDHTWPDQPGDSGELAGSTVTTSLMGALGPAGQLLVGADIPVKRGEPGWVWCVAHVMDEQVCEPGKQVELAVDALRRSQLSASHTGCHLAALAMNSAARSYWRKEARTDSLGCPDLDQLAIVTSGMDESGSVDVYRFGKSLRKKGFDPAGFLAALPRVVADVEATLATWVATQAPVSVADDGDRRITAPRRWSCELPQGLAAIPCGGTHVASLADLGGLRVNYSPSVDGTGLTVRTIHHPPSGYRPAS